MVGILGSIDNVIMHGIDYIKDIRVECSGSILRISPRQA